jgi:DNA-binding response OmpR family regulator
MPPLRALVIDDHPAVTNYLVEMLTVHGINAHGINDAPAALEHLRHTSYDVVLLDVWMLHGIHLLRQLRVFNPDVPVIIVATRDVLPSDADNPNLDDLKIADWIIKPFAGAELRATIARVVDVEAR